MIKKNNGVTQRSHYGCNSGDDSTVRQLPRTYHIMSVISAHLERGTDNVMLLDWSDLAFEAYVKVASRVKHIAMIVSKTFDDLVQLGLDLETFHIVGHSLGAQIGGLVGKYSRNSIPRITGRHNLFLIYFLSLICFSKLLVFFYHSVGK